MDNSERIAKLGLSYQKFRGRKSLRSIARELNTSHETIRNFEKGNNITLSKLLDYTSVLMSELNSEDEKNFKLEIGSLLGIL